MTLEMVNIWYRLELKLNKISARQIGATIPHLNLLENKGSFIQRITIQLSRRLGKSLSSQNTNCTKKHHKIKKNKKSGRKKCQVDFHSSLRSMSDSAHCGGKYGFQELFEHSLSESFGKNLCRSREESLSALLQLQRG